MEFVKNKIIKLFFAFIIIGISGAGIATAANAATFSLSPTTGVFERGCVRSVDIAINATGQSVNAAEIEITYDTSQIDIVDSNAGIPGVQIRTGNAFETYFYNVVDESAGNIKLAGASFVSNLNSNRTFATIEFTSFPSSSSVTFNIRFDGSGATLDSNIADAITNDDLLTGVTNGTYTFTTGPCVADVTPPSVNFISPTNGQTGFPLDGNFTVRMTDDSSGIDLATVELVINGIVYRPSDPQVTYTGGPLNYVFTIDPVDNLPANQASTFQVRGSDLAGNNVSRSITFNVPTPPPPPPSPPTDQIPPYVRFTNPTSTVVDMGLFDPITFLVGDPQEGEVISGVDINSLEVTINGENYDEAEVTYTGTSAEYSIIAIPRVALLEDDINFVRVRARDLQGNRVDTTTAFILSKELFCGEEEDEDLPDDVDVNEIIKEVLEKENCFGETIDINEAQQIINSILNGDGLFDNTALEGTFLDSFVKRNGLSALLALLALLLALLASIPLLSLLFTSPGLFWLRLITFLGKRTRRPWGIVTDAATGAPVPFAICQLFVEGSQYKIGQAVTDLEGKYGFTITEGNYRLEIRQSGFEPFIKPININKDEEGYVYDAQLIPSDSPLRYYSERKDGLTQRIWKAIINTYKFIFPYIFFVGFVFSILSVLIDRTTLNTIIFLIYILIILAYLKNKFTRSGKRASIVDSRTNLRIPFAQIKIYDPTTWKVVDTQVTNYNGMFDFYGEPGKYGILVAVRGYKFPSVKNIYENAKYPGVILVNLKKGRNDVTLFIDPEDLSKGPDINTGNLASPFS